MRIEKTLNKIDYTDLAMDLGALYLITSMVKTCDVDEKYKDFKTELQGIQSAIEKQLNSKIKEFKVPIVKDVDSLFYVLIRNVKIKELENI